MTGVAFSKAFRKCLNQMVEKTESGFDFSAIESLLGDCDRFDAAMFMLVFNSGEDHEALQNKVNMSITLRELINLAQDLEELRKLRAFAQRHEDAVKAYDESTERQSTKYSRFAKDVGLTTGRRVAKFDQFLIFIDYLRAINGVECEKLSKRDALEKVAQDHNIQGSDAVVSHLKRYLKSSKKKFPGILP